jgi:thiamine-phosphate diphosphorylase
LGESLLEILGSTRPILMAIVGKGGALAAGRAFRGGADIVQVRAKQISSGELMRLVREVIAEVGDASRVIVNSRPDIAERAGAGGVHLPESGFDPREVRRAFPGLCVSVSRHDRSGLERAAAEGADFAILGPVFDTPGKGANALGAAGLRAALRDVVVRVIAVGGFNALNALEIAGCGTSGIAAIRPFADPRTAETEAARFRGILDGAFGWAQG